MTRIHTKAVNGATQIKSLTHRFVSRCNSLARQNYSAWARSSFSSIRNMRMSVTQFLNYRNAWLIALTTMTHRTASTLPSSPSFRNAH
jgi:hypothetical protein